MTSAQETQPLTTPTTPSSPGTPQLSVVLPCYNEEKNIPLIFARLAEVLQNRTDVEVILINNGSTDGSAKVFEEQLKAAANPAIRVHLVPVNKGYGYGIMSGVRETRGTFIGWTHADMQTDPRDTLTALELLQKAPNPEKAFLKGRRRNRPPLDELFTLGMAWISSVALGAWLSDINAQPKLFHRSFLEHLSSPPDDFSLDLYALYQAHKKGYQLLEMDVFFAKRQFGEAKGGGTMKGKIKLIKRTWKYILQIRSEIKQGLR
jgi:glycosyltransferase involved in cell wall biosynthesis